MRSCLDAFYSRDQVYKLPGWADETVDCEVKWNRVKRHFNIIDLAGGNLWNRHRLERAFNQSAFRIRPTRCINLSGTCEWLSDRCGSPLWNQIPIKFKGCYTQYSTIDLSNTIATPQGSLERDYKDRYMICSYGRNPSQFYHIKGHWCKERANSWV